MNCKMFRALSLGITLAIAPLQAWTQSLTLTNTLVGPNEWDYEVTIGDGEFIGTNDRISITFGTNNITAIGNPTLPIGALSWSSSLSGTTVTWTVDSGFLSSATGPKTMKIFSVTSSNPSGPVTWNTNTLGGNIVYNGTTVGPVPIPPAVWLFGSGLIGLVGIARRKKIA